MTSDQDLSGDCSRGDYPDDRSGPDSAHAFGDRNRQNGGSKTPDNSHHLRPSPAGSGPASNSASSSGLSGPSPPGAWPSDDVQPRKSGEMSRSRQRNGHVRTCNKCGEPLTGQFVRALDGTFHLDCFKCRDCGQIVASKFFPADNDDGNGQYPLCETDYFGRLGLLCYKCGGALRGSYITALDRKYHIEHFTCSLCPTVFGAQDSYYEHDGNIYCHYHYSTRFAQKCNGCQTAILKQFVEIYRNGQDQHWHPECYMIHKFWNVRLAQPVETAQTEAAHDFKSDAVNEKQIRQGEEHMEDKVYRIWSVLSTFEESSAACISDMLLHVSNGAYVDGVLVAKRFIWHVEVLFQSADRLDKTVQACSDKGMSYGREAKLLCKKIVAFFSLLSKTQDTSVRKLGVTQELLSLVTGLAHYLKLLIRICLQAALRLERLTGNSDGIHQLLTDLADFETYKTDESLLQITMGGAKLSTKDSDHCVVCTRSVEDECAKSGDYRWHIGCVNCSRCSRELGRSLEEARLNPYDGKIYCTRCLAPKRDDMATFEHVSKLQQYAFLLKVALARLLDILRNNGALPNTSAESSIVQGGEESSRLEADRHRESTYENTLNEVRRLRSTRLDRHLASSVRQARTSRVMDADGQGPLPDLSGTGQGEAEGQAPSDLMFGQNDAITLDDIPRIVAAEQSREQQQQQRNSNLRQDLIRSPASEPGRVAGHQRTQSASRDPDVRAANGAPCRLTRKFFPELSGLEYFNVRHLAVLTMQPMVEQEFALEELLGLIESRKPPTFWKNLGKAFKNDKNRNVKKKGVFGVPLDVIIERDGADSTDGVGPGTLRIPVVVEDIISSMRKMDLSVEGVFRKNGNIKKQQEMVDKINAEGCDVVNFMEQPVVQLAALLKRYLRDLPDPLMTHKLYRLWVSAAKMTDPERRKQCLHLTCCLLPKSHRDCLEILFSFLKWAGSFHQVDEEIGSKMDIRNLATVIAPNVLTNPNKAPALDSEAIFIIDAVETLIANIEDMCQVPTEILTLLNDPYLFSNNGETTTKEILRRFQDRREQIPAADVTEVFNRQDTSTRSPPRRVETDPSVWQGERSVRPVQESVMAQPVSSGQGSSGQRQWTGAGERPLPYNQRFNHSDSHLENSELNQRGEWRNSAWGRRGGGVGVGNS
ncbi:hypothetical protein CDD81_1845 [Ophiocordyceps australis]|uniref:Uncharacterized protein n=1 Tax=Ophiocordyceps australis TaxID=1399860 RepID=A0A2C5X7W6_9HYPO|nr:hypothetical protein CDD81_1845 [Ophiocordyceps australis]